MLSLIGCLAPVGVTPLPRVGLGKFGLVFNEVTFSYSVLPASQPEHAQ